MSNEVGFTKGPFGFQIHYENGWTASVQWGWGNYCRNRSMVNNDYNPDFLSSPNAEIAAFPTDKHYSQNYWYHFPDESDVVKGWVNVQEVMEFLNLVSNFAEFNPEAYIFEECETTNA